MLEGCGLDSWLDHGQGSGLGLRFLSGSTTTVRSELVASTREGVIRDVAGNGREVEDRQWKGVIREVGRRQQGANNTFL